MNTLSFTIYRSMFNRCLLEPYTRSKMMPSSVQTGCSKGWRESEQQSKGNRRKIWLFLRPPAPPKVIPPSENSLLHSE